MRFLGSSRSGMCKQLPLCFREEIVLNLEVLLCATWLLLDEKIHRSPCFVESVRLVPLGLVTILLVEADVLDDHVAKLHCVLQEVVQAMLSWWRSAQTNCVLRWWRVSSVLTGLLRLRGLKVYQFQQASRHVCFLTGESW